MNLLAAHIFLAAYGVAALGYIFYLLMPKPLFLVAARGAVGLGFFLHTAAWIHLNFSRGQWGISGLAETRWFFAWLLVLALFVVGYRIKIPVLGCLLLPAAFGFGMSALHLQFSQGVSAQPLHSPWFPLHVFGALVGEALFAVTALLAALYLIQEHQLKSRKIGLLFYRLPALESMDHMIDRVMKWGFLFLTFGLITGAVWAHTTMREQWTFDPKQLWALITWGIYGLMIALRMHGRWNGKRGAILAILGSFVVLFTFLGTNWLYGPTHDFWRIGG